MAADSKNTTADVEAAKLFRTVTDIAPLLWEKAAAVPPVDAARNAGVRFEAGRGFIVPFMGGDYAVDLERRSIETPVGHREAGFQKGLVLLTYLAGAMDIGLSGKMVTGRELNGGDMFFTGPHALLTEPIITRFGGDPEGFLLKAETFGFEREAAGGGAVAFRGLILPHIAVGCILHPADDEFGAELTYTFDSYAHYHLPLDGVWAMINVLAKEIGD